MLPAIGNDTEVTKAKADALGAACGPRGARGGWMRSLRPES